MFCTAFCVIFFKNMYNKSPRVGLKLPTSTPPEVNPFTYMLDDPFYVKRVNVVPFGSSAPRGQSFVKSKYSDTFYDTSEVNRHILGGSSLRNKGKRFVYKTDISDIPSPGAYNVEHHGAIKHVPKIPPPVRGKLYLCRVPYSFTVSTPSIPSKMDENGYDVDDKGRLIKNPPCDCGECPYYIGKSSVVPENPYSGCHWSRRTSKRTTIELAEGPGPAAYDIRKTSACRWNADEEEYREMARRFSYLPRYMEEQQDNARRLGFPGPNQYNLPSSFDYKPQVTTIFKPFLTKQARFLKSKKVPYSIYDVRMSIGSVGSPSISNVPFSVGANRLQETSQGVTPGPGYYDMKSFTDDLYLKNFNRYGLSRAAFNSSVKRDTTFVGRDSYFMPGSADYPREKCPDQYTIQHENSVFASSTQRKDLNTFETPGPAEYNVAAAVNKIKRKISHNKRRLPFQSTARRNTLDLIHKDDPGPADYLGADMEPGKGYFFNRSPRFREEEPTVPPPDHYYIHPVYGESMYKAKDTYNLMIAESVLQKKLRLPPKETYKDYVKALKKKKLLRCYATILDEL